MGYNFSLILINATGMRHNVHFFLLHIRSPYSISQLVKLQNNIKNY